MDEFINIPTKAEEKSVIQVSFMTQDPRIKNSQLIHVPLCFQNPRNPLDLPQKSTIRAFFRPNLSIRKPIHPHLYRCQSHVTLYINEAYDHGINIFNIFRVITLTLM